MKLKDILTQKETKIKRYRNIVGKQVGSQLYVHRNYANEVIPNNILKFAAKKLKEIYPTFKFNSIMWDKNTNIIRFDESPDFDTAREPHVGKYIAISPNGNFREGYSNNIWHHKWLWVKDNYRGFNVEESKKWSEWWISKLQGIAKGTDTSFGDQLNRIGLKELLMTETPKNTYFYHATTCDELPDIVKNGLIPSSGETNWGGDLGKWSEGKVFLSDFDGANYYGNVGIWMKQHPNQFKPLLRLKVDRNKLFQDPKSPKDYYSTVPILGPFDVYVGEESIDDKGNVLRQNNSNNWRHLTEKEANAIFYGEWDGEIIGDEDYINESLIVEASKDEAGLDWLKEMVQSGLFKGKVFLAGGAIRDMEMKQLILESETDNSDEWDNWMEYLDYFDYDIDKTEVVKLIKKHGLDGRKYLGGRIVKLWDRKQECYLEHDKNDGTVSLIKDIDQWVYDKGEDVIDIDSSEIYNSWVESSLKDLRENPGKVYHYTTEENWNEIQKSGRMVGSAGTGLTNRGEYGIFTSTDPEEYASGTYGNVCLELNLEQFKNDSGLKALDLSFEPDVIEYLIRGYVRSQLELEESHDDIDSSGGMSPYTVIVAHDIPLKYIRQI